MNPYLEKLSFQQLLNMFMKTTKEFIAALETQRSFKELKLLRDEIRTISEVIEAKRNQFKQAC
jgi:hypothetical protein